jgi:hypothetical protein
MRAAPFLALAGLLLLSACSGGDGDTAGMTGVWETTASFRADTVVAATNYRVKADYDVTFTFDVTHDDGLVWGTVTAVFDGFLIAREAGRPADTLRFDGNPVLVDQVFGTLIGEDAELDVPFTETYEDDLWTFKKVAGRLDLVGEVVNKWGFARLNAEPDSEPFEYVIRMAQRPLVVQRLTRESEAGATPPAPSPQASARVLAVVEGDSQAASLRSITAPRTR